LLLSISNTHCDIYTHLFGSLFLIPVYERCCFEYF